MTETTTKVAVHPSAALLELAANDEAEALRAHLEVDPSAADEPAPWYGRRHSLPRRMFLDPRTPLMVAATFASLDSLRLLLSLPSVDVNRPIGPDRSTPLHCAAAGGLPSSPSAVRLLLSAGADPLALDASSLSPADVAAGPPPIRNSILHLLGASPPPAPPPERREYPLDPTLPDIKNSVYSTDEFRMFSFKVRPCSRAYSHDWTECPFVHPGENARRRDPRKFHYSCVPCPDFRKGACRRGDHCEYAHGVFECWLHPAQYRTRLCKDGTSCSRRVCFFAHTHDELRPLYLNLSSAAAPSSPRSAASSPALVMDMAAALGMLPTSPMSPSAAPTASPNPNINLSVNVPSLHLTGSRLRSALSAREMAMDQELAMLQEIEHQQLLNAAAAASHGRLNLNLKSLAPSNLDELFNSEMSLSPRYAMEQSPGMYSPSHKAAMMMRELQQQQQQGVLSPVNTNHTFLHAIGSPGRMSSPRGIEPVSPIGARLVAAVSQREKLRSLSSRELGGSREREPAGNPWSKWGGQASNSGVAEWAVDGDELGRLRRSNSFEHALNGDEPDVSWVQSLVKESPTDAKERSGKGSADDLGGGGSENGGGDHGALGPWLEQMQL